MLKMFCQKITSRCALKLVHKESIYTQTQKFSTSQQLRKQSVALSYSQVPGPSDANSSPLLITHGLLGSKVNWTSIAKALTKSTSRSVITFDARNHGDSPHAEEMDYDTMAVDILQLSNQLNLSKFSLMGHSMGGRTVMTFAMRYPEKMDKLIVVDVSPTLFSSHFWEIKSYLRALAKQTFEEKKLPLSKVRSAVDKALASVAPDPAIRAFLLTNLAEDKTGKIHWKPNLKVLIQNLNKIAEFPRDLLHEQVTYSGPTLFIRGGNSLYIPDSEIPYIKKKFTQAEVVTVSGAGHWPHAEKPAEFIKIVTQFLNS